MSNRQDNTKTTVLIISMGFLILFLIFKWEWAVYVSIFVGLIGIISRYLSKKIEWLWMKLAKILSFIVPNILLTLVFFLILYPISLISRIFTKDPLMLSGKHDSYFVDVDKEFTKKNFEEIW